ncbi:MAG TPA: potassium-transporting ATPase subunit KdpC [Thermodesulfobacteriota bacterium]|nr:potassium-transporting ATPase subunit KdpC [Thermodesulfobacteriota bacterium]
MKALRQIIVLHSATVVLFALAYPLLIWVLGQALPRQAKGLPIIQDGKVVGLENVGQKFTDPKYFWGRPSVVDYDASSTGGSNKGPTNPEYIKTLEQRIETFLASDPEVKRSDIPVELITASGSGLDPHITPQAAYIQVPRIAQERNIDEAWLKDLVEQHIEKPLFGLFGPPARVNVLKLNLALDELSSSQAAK